MEGENPVKVFISYSHADEAMAKRLIACLTPLVEDKLITIWFDRLIRPGTEWERAIEEHIETADLMIYGISLDFCNSQACKRELIKGLKLRKEVKTEVLPVIFKPCPWKDIKVISGLQAVPKDGVPICEFSSVDKGYMDVYDAVKDIAGLIHRRKNLCFTSEFKSEMDSIGALAALNFSGKEGILFSELFVYPDLMDQSSVTTARSSVSSMNLPDKVDLIGKIVLSGESQSGKTSICKQLMKDLRDRGYYPVLFSGREAYEGNMERRLKDYIKKQYADPDCIESKFIVPILDDFHKAANKEDVLSAFRNYEKTVITVDDVYDMDVSNAATLSEYSFFRIEPLSALKRDDLISKWVQIRERITGETDANYEQHDRLKRDVDQTLGKVLGRGVIPAYPFYILSILVTVEAAARPLDGEVTSQGYCYETLLTLSLAKAGVGGSMQDSYKNLLTELGFYHFKHGDGVTKTDLEAFFKKYRSVYVLKASDAELLKRLAMAGIYSLTTLGVYSFTQRYLKYYFTARYISINITSCQDEYHSIINNLGNSSNAYIAVFMAHHGRNLLHLEELKNLLSKQFASIPPCFLRKEDTDELDKRAKRVSKAVLPGVRSTPALGRKEELRKQCSVEARVNEDVSGESKEVRELITAIRGTEVIGQIIKCRAGSIAKDELGNMMSAIIEVHGKILASFLETFKEENSQQEIVGWISRILKRKYPDRMDLEQKAESLFWQINYFTILGIVFRCIQTVGSDKLYDEVEKVCSKYDSPMTRLIPIGVRMWFNKILDDKRICFEYEESTGIVRWILQQLVARYCTTHKIDYKVQQYLGAKLEIEMAKLT